MIKAVVIECSIDAIISATSEQDPLKKAFSREFYSLPFVVERTLKTNF